jgi:heme b synthase
MDMNTHTAKTISPLRLVAWELTRSCNLACAHCRASSERGPYPGELTPEEAKTLLKQIASFSSPIIILTGGEPLLREDTAEIARYGTELGCRMVLATNGTLLDETSARDLKAAGIKRISISIDGRDETSHDALRAVPGAFAGALFGVENAKRAGLSFQINTTITKRNAGELSEIETMVRDIGAHAHHLFLLVPTGRGSEMAHESLDAHEYEEILSHIYFYEKRAPYPVKVTCAPQYQRIKEELSREEGDKAESPNQTHHTDHEFASSTRGCLGGISFLFISHDGKAQPCGYLEVTAGDVRKQSVREIWEGSDVFLRLRDYSRLKGKCKNCDFVDVCGGCRARALYHHGDYLAPEPLCPYIPPKRLKE